MYGLPAVVNSMLAIHMSACSRLSRIILKYELKSYVESFTWASSICLVCIMTSPIILIVSVSLVNRGVAEGRLSGRCSKQTGLPSWAQTKSRRDAMIAFIRMIIFANISRFIIKFARICNFVFI